MRRIVPLAVVIVVVAIPVAVLASHQFADVPDTQPFHTEIGWMRDNNITQGSTECGSPPPEQTFYCPESTVRRDAMAAFLYRVANNQVVDAGKLEGQSLSDLDGRYVNHGQADSVTSAMIVDGNVTSLDIADGGVTNTDLAFGSVTTDKILDNTIGSQDIANGGVTNADLASNSVTTDKIVNGTIGFQDWAPACSPGQVPKSTGSGWVCGNDNIGALGASGTSSGVWASLSDRNAKEAFWAVDSRSVLAGVVGLDISSWRYQGEETSIRHLGPTAQDFAAAFGVGDSKTHIANVDANGVALAAIQGLNQKVEALEARLADADTPESGAVPIWALLLMTTSLALAVGRRWGMSASTSINTG